MSDSNSPLDDNTPDPSKDAVPFLPRRARFHEVQDESVPEAVTRSSPDRQAKALELARLAARIAEENRARDIELLDLRQSTPLFDFFVVITSPSRRQASAIISEIDHEMKQRQEFKLGIEGSDEGRWTLIDYGDFVVHVFSDEARDFYQIEDIWGDAPRLDLKADGTPTAPEDPDVPPQAD